MVALRWMFSTAAAFRPVIVSSRSPMHPSRLMWLAIEWKGLRVKHVKLLKEAENMAAATVEFSLVT